MNRSFRAQESKMQAALKQREQQFGGLRASVMKEKDEELALFLEMKKREKERNDLLLHTSEEFDAALGSNPGTSPIFNISSSTPAPVRKTGVDDFLNSENDKNDYDWLLTPPGTPLFPSLEMETRKTVMSQLGTPATRPMALKSRLANHQSEPPGRTSLVSKQPTSSPGLSSASGGTRRPSSSGGPGSRPATPTGRSTLTPASKSSRPSTPTRATLPSTRSMVATSKTTISSAKPAVSATKSLTSATKTPVPAAKPTIPRSSTPLSRSNARSSTPTSRPTLPPSRSTSRASTPTRRPSIEPSISASSVKASSSPKPATVTSRQPTPVTARQRATVTSRQPVPSRGTSPTVRSRPWKPSEMPGFSLDAPPNLRTTLPERPLSATRGRPGAPTSRSSSVEPSSSGRPRRQSCSPSRGRSSNGTVHISGNSMPAVSRGHSKVNDNVSPVVIGNKMVERVINMRKLAPPMIDDKNSPRSNLSGKSSSSPDSSGFGRTLSKKSLDMAIRHMDIRRTIPGNLRPLMTNIPASSMYSVRSGPQRGRTISVSSPHATSSNASSEVSVNQNGLCLDSSEVDDDIGSERCGQSPASVRGR
ncbi:mucin-5AC [Abrus precatorius]|uniref:Mucin-5AC n=1 Tax=Abrus precatorius TaxID=3816 RepID=A0A8B8JV05_ABRPR|nr:mucin-5AC [Abrus precatorius]